MSGDELDAIAHLITRWAEIIVGVGAIGGGIFTLYRWVIPTFKRLVKSLREIEFVAEQLKPNGGKSLRDAVNRMEHTIDMLQTDSSRMDARQWAIVASLDEPIWESDPNGAALRVNPAMLALTHTSVEDYLGNNWENTIHPADRQRVWGEWQDAVEKRRVFKSSYRVVSTINQVFRVDAIATPYISSRTGEIMGWVGRYVRVEPSA